MISMPSLERIPNAYGGFSGNVPASKPKWRLYQSMVAPTSETVNTGCVTFSFIGSILSLSVESPRHDPLARVAQSRSAVRHHIPGRHRIRDCHRALAAIRVA